MEDAEVLIDHYDLDGPYEEIFIKQEISEPEDYIVDTSASVMSNAEAPLASHDVCTVCGDKAAGFFYGTYSCEGCKGFYRRAVLFKKDGYTCVNSEDPGACVITVRTRNVCRYCRLLRCREMGMQEEVVKAVMKRSTSRIKSRARKTSLKRPSVGRKADSENSPEKQSRSLLSPIDQLKQAFRAYFPECAKKFKIKDIKPVLLSDRAMDQKSPYYKHVMFSAFSDNYAPFVDNVAQFCKKIPEFEDLGDDDQLILMKTGFVDVWLLLNARTFNDYNGACTLWDGTQIPQCEFSVIFSKHYVSTVLKLYDEVARLDMSLSAVSIMAALTITCPDRPNLLGEERVKEIQDSLVFELRNYLQSYQLLDKVPAYMAVLSSVYDLGKMHSQIINSYRSDIDKLKLDPIVSQLLDLAVSGSGKAKDSGRHHVK